MNTDSVADIIRECKNGSRDAFRRLVEVYYQTAFSMAYYWCGNRDAAFDLSQEAFVRIYQHIRDYDNQKPFEAWLYTIVKNLCRNHRRRLKSYRRLFRSYDSANLEQMSADNDFFRKSEKEENARIVWQGIKKLADPEREIILLRDFQDYSYDEIARILEIPTGTVMSRLYYARKKLSKILEDQNAI